jgi:hypothetical protein
VPFAGQVGVMGVRLHRTVRWHVDSTVQYSTGLVEYGTVLYSMVPRYWAVEAASRVKVRV